MTDNRGASGETTKQITVLQPLPTVRIHADPPAVPAGESTTLVWSSTHAESASIDQAIGDVPVNGTIQVSPTKTTTYTITVQGPHGSAVASLQVVVIAPPDDVDLGLDSDEQEGGGGLVGETARILNGNVVEYRGDLRFPSPNTLGLTFEAFYNSRSARVGIMGYGWSHTYGASLDRDVELGGVPFMKVIDETGRAHYFKRTGEGIFGERTHVRAEADGYIWYRLEGTRYCFNGAGQLKWIEDEKGNRLDLTYNAQSLPEKVTDTASGRTLTLHYNESGRLASVSGPLTAAVLTGYWVTYYGYTESGNLTSVTYADGSGFTYSYGDAMDVHNLTEKRDRAGHLLNAWGYDTQDRAIENFSVDGKGVALQYESDTRVHVTDAYGTVRPYTLTRINGRSRVIAMTGIAGAPYSESNAIRWVYDGATRLVEVQQAGGRIDQYLNHDIRGNPGTVRLAAGTTQERIIAYTYHPDMNVPLSRTEGSVLGGGSKVTLWDYDDDYNGSPNENPTRILSRIVEMGFTKDGAGAIYRAL